MPIGTSHPRSSLIIRTGRAEVTQRRIRANLRIEGFDCGRHCADSGYGRGGGKRWTAGKCRRRDCLSRNVDGRCQGVTVSDCGSSCPDLTYTVWGNVSRARIIPLEKQSQAHDLESTRYCRRMLSVCYTERSYCGIAGCGEPGNHRCCHSGLKPQPCNKVCGQLRYMVVRRDVILVLRTLRVCIMLWD